jgi:lyso-ornithine lipid O-acyltransferase
MAMPDSAWRQLARRTWRIPAVALWIGCGLILSAGVALLPSSRSARIGSARQQLTRWWMRGLLHLLPLQIRCHGQPAAGTRLLVSNHVSWLDIVLIGAHAPVHFLSKAEVRDWPVIGWLASAAGTLFIQRGQASGSALQSQLASALQQGCSLVIFAEGTTTAGDQVRTFHGRLMSCAIDAATQIQPVAIAYRKQGQRDTTAPFINDDEFSTHLLRLLGSSRIDVDLHFLGDLSPQAGNRNHLARCAHSAVSQALQLNQVAEDVAVAAPLRSAA